ncbi:MAG: hypothetical protein ACN6QY_22335 [Pseudomonas sp.]|uniref:hypothetical protein n=1 Tax=unclassified Pseudomonas TaxID=196821 RepID=UPI0007317D18|nr:hypothetical protein [Pseudomonas sp. L5B5]KTC37733.1 hypothetical protein AO265_39450 [Pseudomonas sp. ABAC61]UCZ86258.1 hypothetical protein LGQ10_08150 [Pseudomonas sp. L5B5]
MPLLRRASLQHLPAFAAIALGLAIAIARAIEPLDYFWENFAAYWLPQGLIIGLLWFTRPASALVAGAALALAIHLLLFCLWITTPQDALGWIYYLLNFPGAAIGAAAARYLASRRPPRSALGNALLGFFGVALGLLVNFKLQ